MMRHRMGSTAMLLLLAALVAGGGGCAWMGKAAGKAQAKVENKVDAMDRSYHESYEQERAKGSSGKQDASGAAEETGKQ